MSICNTKITIQLLYEMCIHSMDTAITCAIVNVAIILDFHIAYFKHTRPSQLHDYPARH